MDSTNEQIQSAENAGRQGVAMSERRDMLKEFIRVVQDVLPMLDLMKTTIEEGSSKIPKASDQLNNVTQATETATVEILNVLDSMSNRIQVFEQMLSQLAVRNARLTEIGEALSQRLKTQPGLEDIEKMWSEYSSMTLNTDLFVAASKSLSDEKADNMSIAMALQVQDITSQQIAGAIHLIESVRAQLTQVMSNFEQVGKPPSAGGGSTISGKPILPDTRTFDTDAQFTHSPQRQQRADDIITNWNNESSQ
jgi:chemotaxis regulatin CheY-phosphate phosphatase CheZ